MNDTPTTAAPTNSAATPGNSTGTAAPATRPADPMRMGLRTPTRSERRPALTANSMGSSAYSAISTPTMKGDAPRESASSDTVTRLPPQHHVIGDAERDQREQRARVALRRRPHGASRSMFQDPACRGTRR